MEDDNHTLLMKILKHHFRERPAVLEEAMREVNACSNNANKFEYEKTLTKLYNLMSNDLPSKILLYFLTMVPLPTRENSQSNVMELMRKTHDSLPENIRPVLLDYLNNKKSPTSSPKKVKRDEKEEKTVDVDSTKVREEIKKDNKCVTSDKNLVCKKLVDICAEYVFLNESELKKTYANKHTQAWEAINGTLEKDNLKQCYEVVKDINKKRKWLRMFEDEDITIEVFNEEYGNSEILLKQAHVFNTNEDDEDPLRVSDRLQDAVLNFINRC